MRLWPRKQKVMDSVQLEKPVPDVRKKARAERIRLALNSLKWYKWGKKRKLKKELSKLDV